jgi:hypothetical protein
MTFNKGERRISGDLQFCLLDLEDDKTPTAILRRLCSRYSSFVTLANVWLFGCLITFKIICSHNKIIRMSWAKLDAARGEIKSQRELGRNNLGRVHVFFSLRCSPLMQF